MKHYSRDIEHQMKDFFDSLSETDGRRYAAVEADKLGRGGVEYVKQILGCDGKTIRQGRMEIERLCVREISRE